MEKGLIGEKGFFQKGLFQKGAYLRLGLDEKLPLKTKTLQSNTSQLLYSCTICFVLPKVGVISRYFASTMIHTKKRAGIEIGAI